MTRRVDRMESQKELKHHDSRARTQFIFWSTIIVTGLNGLLLLIFRPISAPPQVEPSVAVSDGGLTGAMVAYMRASDHQKAEVLYNAIRAARLHSPEDPRLADGVRFMVETWKTEPIMSPEWWASLEGIVQLGGMTRRLQGVAEVELLRVVQDPKLKSLKIPALQTLFRIGSEAGLGECIALTSVSRSPAARREALVILAGYAREMRGIAPKEPQFRRVIGALQRVVETDPGLRPLAALALARVGEPVSSEVIEALLREGATWTELRAGIGILRVGRRVDELDRLAELSRRIDLSAELQQEAAQLRLELGARSVASRARSSEQSRK